MRRCIDETERRRDKQMRYNAENGITPTQITKERTSLLDNEALQDTRQQYGTAVDKKISGYKIPSESSGRVADGSRLDYNDKATLRAEIEKAKADMLAAAKQLDFIEAAHRRDYMLLLEERLKGLTPVPAPKSEGE